MLDAVRGETKASAGSRRRRRRKPAVGRRGGDPARGELAESSSSTALTVVPRVSERSYGPTNRQPTPAPRRSPRPGLARPPTRSSPRRLSERSPAPARSSHGLRYERADLSPPAARRVERRRHRPGRLRGGVNLGHDHRRRADVQRRADPCEVVGATRTASSATSPGNERARLDQLAAPVHPCCASRQTQSKPLRPSRATAPDWSRCTRRRGTPGRIRRSRLQLASRGDAELAVGRGEMTLHGPDG